MGVWAQIKHDVHWVFRNKYARKQKVQFILDKYNWTLIFILTMAFCFVFGVLIEIIHYSIQIAYSN